jgi:hypothetical protein
VLFQIINQPWPVTGAIEIPTARILDLNDLTDMFAQLAKTAGLLTGVCPPNIMALDQAAYEATKLYPTNWKPIPGPGVIQD